MLVFVGVATDDAIALVDRYPGADERVAALELTAGGGGPAATAAVAAARLGMETALISAVGVDEEGSRIIAELATEGVDVTHVTRIPGERSARSLITISRAGSTRAIVNRRGPEISLADRPGAMDLIAHASWVHVDQHGWAPVRDLLDRLDGGPRLSVDAGNEIPDYRPANTALYVPTDRALESRYSRPGLDNGLEHLLHRAQSDGAEVVAATRGPQGAIALTADGHIVSTPAPDVDILSTLGAGDVFHGALLAGLTLAEPGGQASDLQHALALATVVSSLSCRGLDGRSRIPDRSEAMAVLAATDRPQHTDLPQQTDLPQHKESP